LEFFENNSTISLACVLRSPHTPTLWIYSKGNTEILAGIGEGRPIEKTAFGIQKL